MNPFDAATDWVPDAEGRIEGVGDERPLLRMRHAHPLAAIDG